ncbi:MAG: single-stranded DNA-binding protein [Endomicrobium sp.]|jgi:single-strand DNA-binding protein|nr:single-stranded DNA-binding protein [Endomicrobium sp.]
MDQEKTKLTYRIPEQNKVCLVGRVTKDPELRRTGTGKAVCSFDVAVSRRIKDTVTGQWRDADPTFVPIVVWNDQAERCKERLLKGFPVHIEGRLQSNNWKAPDGTNRSRLEVIASRVQFLSVIKKEFGEIAKETDDTTESKQEVVETEEDSYEEIPF